MQGVTGFVERVVSQSFPFLSGPEYVSIVSELVKGC